VGGGSLHHKPTPIDLLPGKLAPFPHRVNRKRKTFKTGGGHPQKQSGDWKRPGGSTGHTPAHHFFHTGWNWIGRQQRRDGIHSAIESKTGAGRAFAQIQGSPAAQPLGQHTDTGPRHQYPAHLPVCDQASLSVLPAYRPTRRKPRTPLTIGGAPINLHRPSTVSSRESISTWVGTRYPRRKPASPFESRAQRPAAGQLYQDHHTPPKRHPKLRKTTGAHADTSLHLPRVRKP